MTVIGFPEGDEIWKERTFFDQKNGGYYKCFTYLRRWEQLPGPSDCQQRFLLDFDAITDSNNLSQMEVFVHDRREDFTNLGLLKPEQFVVVRNTITKLLIRPEIIQKQSRMENPCTMDESYSQTRCLEKCFWERIQTNPSLPCLFPSLMPKEVNLTKPECQTASAEIEQSQTLRKSMGAVMDQLWNCNCPERCSVTDYHILSDPTSACQTSGIENGKALLFYRFPSSRVPYSLEMGKLTLPDLVWNVGGIVSIYLGLSLIMLSDIIEQGCFNFPCRAFRRGNEIHGEND
ncbi:unnamed protein product [Darwinula stevensoni]|uniref:Uncharacterized protein n=1 Tax=Darwinula stevensoni TaxID=69355 RepID=A0A7R9A4V9_9CRUS|nr:unnamed protein product [Darwinula stevensoni]CAG0893320.1 unnamed protein product [Darwinula stevensoni]